MGGVQTISHLTGRHVDTSSKHRLRAYKQARRADRSAPVSPACFSSMEILACKFPKDMLESHSLTENWQRMLVADSIYPGHSTHIHVPYSSYWEVSSVMNFTLFTITEQSDSSLFDAKIILFHDVGCLNTLLKAAFFFVIRGFTIFNATEKLVQRINLLFRG